jgi:DNA-binding response OmpR family regulator
MSGMELAGKLLEQKIEVPFAVITAERDEQRLKLLRQLGALKIFKKPVNGEELVSFVKGIERGESDVDSDACNYQVLLAMGDETTAGFIEEALTDEELTYRTVTDGYLASTELSAHPPIAVIDMALSGIDGKEILERLKSSEQGARTRVLTLDAKLDDARKAELTKLGSDAVLAKPFKVKQLISEVRELLSSVKQTVDVSEFVDAFEEELSSLPAPESAGYFEQAKRLGHNLAGTAGLISSTELHDAGVALEKAAKGNELELCKNEVAKIRKIIAGFRGEESTAEEASENGPASEPEQSDPESSPEDES